MRRFAVVALAGLIALLLTALVGCGTGLPRIRVERLALTVKPIPENASPVHQWTGSRSGLRTYWGEQAITCRVAAFVPDHWTQPGDGFWQVEACNTEGKPIPYIGVLKRYRNENETRLAVIVPEFDLSAAPDGLYLIVEPGIGAQHGKIASIRPTAFLVEIRDGYFKPFRVMIPLRPTRESPLTPAPPPFPEPPSGTPIALD